MHIYGKDQQAFHLTRTPAEKYFSRFNAIIVAMQLACWFASIIRVAMHAPNTMTNPMFSTSDLALTDAYLVPGCIFNVSRTHAFFNNVTYQMSANNIEYFVSRSVNNLRLLYALTGCFTVVSTVNRVFFETNTHELRYHFVVFRKDTLTTWEVLLLILGIVMTFGVTTENQLLQAYLLQCSGQTVGVLQFYSSAFPLVELYVSYFVSLGFMVLNGFVAVFNLAKENPRDKLLREDRRRQQEWQELMRAYAHPTSAGQGSGGGGGSARAPPSPPRSPAPPALTPAAVATGEDAYAYTSSSPGQPPPALRRQPVVPPGVPPAPAGSLYANRLPGRSPGTPSPTHRGSPGDGGRSAGGRPPAGAPLTAAATNTPQLVPPSLPQPVQPTLESSGPGRLSSSGNGAMYELREVHDDEHDDGVQNFPLDATNPDSVDFSVDGGGAYGGAAPAHHRQHTNKDSAGGNGSGSTVHGKDTHMGDRLGGDRSQPQPQQSGLGGAPGALATPLLATRTAAIPPPPPVSLPTGTEGGTGGAVRAGHRPSIGKMLAPPSPLNNAGDTTTDTLYM